MKWIGESTGQEAHGEEPAHVTPPGYATDWKDFRGPDPINPKTRRQARVLELVDEFGAHIYRRVIDEEALPVLCALITITWIFFRNVPAHPPGWKQVDAMVRSVAAYFLRCLGHMDADDKNHGKDIGEKPQ